VVLYKTQQNKIVRPPRCLLLYKKAKWLESFDRNLLFGNA